MLEQNLGLEETLYNLRDETKTAFDEAKALEARWKDLEREQRDVYQVCSTYVSDIRAMFDDPGHTALHPSIPPHEIETRYNRPR